MIKAVREENIAECVQVIRAGFATVAEAFGFTAENAPGFTAFATTEDTLRRHLLAEHRLLFAYWDGDRIVGYYSLKIQEEQTCELNHLCVLPACRGKGIGAALLRHAEETAGERGCRTIRIGIVEDNKVLRKWYESYGFVHLGTKKFAHLPFTCGFLEKTLA